MPFVDYMQASFGRILQVVVGLALTGLGLFAVGGLMGTSVVMIGIVPQ
jgi:hypothetical protein